MESHRVPYELMSLVSSSPFMLPGIQVAEDLRLGNDPHR